MGGWDAGAAAHPGAEMAWRPGSVLRSPLSQLACAAGASEEDEQWQLLGNGAGSSSGDGGPAPREVELMQRADTVPSTSALTDDSLRRRKQSDAIASSYMHDMEADASATSLGPAGAHLAT